ncbi:MAG: fumarylacetoacetase [Acidobacteriaceae bacterium]
MTYEKSWVVEANDPANGYPLANLPFGVFLRGHDRHVGIAIGNSILDLRACVDLGYFDELPRSLRDACWQPTLNVLMGQGNAAVRMLREAAAQILGENSFHRDNRLLVPRPDARMLLPVDIGDYTDFYASIDHATRVGRLFRPDQPLLPNYKYVPVGYHGRASSIVVSGTQIRRPGGQIKLPDATAPIVGPTHALDYELEAGFLIGKGSAQSEPISIDRAEDHIFGFCLVNDWSARDIQSWEYQPLGPFLSKSFATTISPWIVTLDALEPFRVPSLPRPRGDPDPLPYLAGEAARAFDIQMEVYLQSLQMRDAGLPPVRLSHGNLRHLYWTPAQMLAHHTSNGCPMRTGDLLATGTVSGPSDDSRGCMLEITERGAKPLSLPSGETRSFLEDGDEVILRAWCQKPGYPRISFGECRGVVLGAVS